MNRLFNAAVRIQQFCDAEAWRSCIIGALAVQRWGEPRLTLDVDVSLLTGFGTEAAFIDRLLTAFTARRPDAREFALQYRVLLLEADDDVPLDIVLAAMPFEERCITRASPYHIAANTVIRTCSAEDLIVLKAFADRPQDWLDVGGIIARQRHRLDVSLIWDELIPLLQLKDDVVTEGRLRQLLGGT
jgi:hypothetical protein